MRGAMELFAIGTFVFLLLSIWIFLFRLFGTVVLFLAALHQCPLNGLALIFREASIAIEVVLLQDELLHLLHALELLRGEFFLSLRSAVVDLLGSSLSLNLRAFALLGFLFLYPLYALALLRRDLLGSLLVAPLELLRTSVLLRFLLVYFLHTHLLHVLALLGRDRMRRVLSARLELLPTTRGLLCIRTLALWSASLLHLLLHWSPTGRALLSLLSDCGARSTLLWFLSTLLLCIGRDRSCEYRQSDGGWDSCIHGIASYGFIPRSWAYNGR